MTRQKHRTTEDQQRWQAEQEARTTALMEQLEAGIQAIQSSDDFKAYLAAAAKFHSYSYANVLLVLAQYPTATRVAGYKTWQSLGRQVNKGERAIYIDQCVTMGKAPSLPSSLSGRTESYGNSKCR